MDRPFPNSLLLAAAWLAGWCLFAGAHAQAPAPAPAQDRRADIVIGMVNAQTGPASALGQGMLAGAQAVIRSVNARGGVHGRRIVLRVADDAYEPEQTVEHALRLIEQEKVLALMGLVGTPTANAVLPVVAELGVPVVGVFSGASSLRRPVVPTLFNVRASYDDEAEALVAQLVADGARRVAVVYQHDGFGIAVLSGTTRALARRGLEVVATGTFQRNTTAIQMALATMVERQPDAVVIVGPYAPVAAFVTRGRAAGLNSRLATVSFVGTESLLARLGGEGEGMLISQVVPFPGDDNRPVARQCRSALKQHADEALTFVNFEGCLTALVLVRALEQAGPTVTPASLVASLDAMRQFDLGGVELGFSPGDHQGSQRVFLTRISGQRVIALN